MTIKLLRWLFWWLCWHKTYDWFYCIDIVAYWLQSSL